MAGHAEFIIEAGKELGLGKEVYLCFRDEALDHRPTLIEQLRAMLSLVHEVVFDDTVVALGQARVLFKKKG